MHSWLCYSLKGSFYSAAREGKGMPGGSRLQLGEILAEVLGEHVGSGCSPLAPFDEGWASPLQGPYHQVQPFVPLNAQPHGKGGCQADRSEEEQQVEPPAACMQYCKQMSDQCMPSPMANGAVKQTGVKRNSR